MKKEGVQVLMVALAVTFLIFCICVAVSSCNECEKKGGLWLSREWKCIDAKEMK